MTFETEISSKKPSSTTLGIFIVLACLISVLSFILFENSLQFRATIIAGICLLLWLSEIVPAYVPTLVLWALTTILLSPISKEFGLAEVLKWSANPVLLLFFGGFSFGVAASRYSIDAWMAKLAVKFSGGRSLSLLFLTAGVTAFTSMWMSNIAAAAMMIAALHPLTSNLEKKNSFRIALLLAITVGANFGGIATPIGTGPNAIAISALAKTKQITFAEWMSFSMPLAIGLILLGTLWVAIFYRVKGNFETGESKIPGLSPKGKLVIVIFALTILSWLTESLHGVSSAVVAIISSALLFGSGLLTRKDLNAIDWGTIALIAGGISLGNLLEQAHLVQFWAKQIPWSTLPLLAQIFIVCFTSALLAAVMSNTGTVTMLIPFATTFIHEPAIAILVAISASLGVPFIISTPINAMVHGEGGITAKDFFAIGFPLMILGCILLTLTGVYFLSYWF